MKRSELKQIIREVIEESRVILESFDMSKFVESIDIETERWNDGACTEYLSLTNDSSAKLQKDAKQCIRIWGISNIWKGELAAHVKNVIETRNGEFEIRLPMYLLDSELNDTEVNDELGDEGSIADILDNEPGLIARRDAFFAKYPEQDGFKEVKSTNASIKANDKTIKRIIKSEITRLGAKANLNHIDVSAVTDMFYLFGNNNDFNGDISDWDVSNVLNMNNLFADCDFNGDISSWDVSNVILMNNMFEDSKFNGDISDWDVSNVTEIRGMFKNSQFNGDISSWNTSKVFNMIDMFKDAKSFDGDLSSWHTSNIKFIDGMFANTNYTGEVGEYYFKNGKKQ